MNNKHTAIIFVIVTVGLASSLSLLGGLGIETVNESLLKITPLLIVLPALNSLVGDYATIIAAHAGNKDEAKKSKIRLAKAIVPSLIINCILITALGLFLGDKRGYDADSIFVAKYCMFVVTSIVVVVGMMFGITAILDRLLKNKALNPDDVLIPIVTTVTDIFMLGLIALSAVVLF